MTTATQAERLARKIAEAMAAQASDGQAAKLAQDYADLCRAANRRLEQCALMIEAGQDLQALQLAETPPPLLDLITVLNFREAADWRNYCQTHQFPWAEPFYDKHLRQLNSAYGKGISSDHPYYRDYRRAVLRKKDDRALSILRVIARMNPSDENTVEELKRVEEKILRGKLEKLRDALATGDATALAGQLAEIDASGVRVPPNNPIWQQAQVVRCQELIRRAVELRQKDDWQGAEALVDQIHSVATHNDLKLPAADADDWTFLSEWTAEKHRAYAADQDFQRALSALEYEVQTVEAKRNAGNHPALIAATRQAASLSNKWSEAERCGRPLSEDLTARYQQCQSWLQRQMQAAALRRRIAIGAVVVLILGGIGASIPSIRDWIETRNLAHRMASLESSRQLADLQALLAQVPPRLAPRLSGQAAGAQEFIAREAALKQSFDQSMSGLQELAAGGFRGDLEQVGARRPQAAQLLEQIAPEFQPSARNVLQEWDGKWQAFRNTALNAQLTQAEQLAPALNGTNGSGAVDAAKRIQSILNGASALKIEPPALDATLAARSSKLADLAAQWMGYWEHWQKAGAAVAAAESVEEYVDRLDRLVQSPFASSRQRDAAAEIDRVKINSETLLGELLLPNNQPSWDLLTNAAAWRTTLMPEQPTAQEKDLYFKLRDDKNMQNVYYYQLVTNARRNNPFHTHLVFARGSITMDRGGQMAGQVYDPEVFRDTVHFAPVVYSDWDFIYVVRTNRTPECDAYERIGLGDLIDPNTGNYQKPIVQLLDQLARDDGSSAIFRAFVSMRLFELLELRPEAWGTTWCPTLSRHFLALKDLGALDLRSGDWMAPAAIAKYEAGFQRYFQQARKIPLEKEARLLQGLAQQTCQTDFSYAGCMGIDGRPVLRHTSAGLMEYWGWGSSPETATMLLRKPAGTDVDAVLADPLPCTPLFIFNGDRHRLLSDAVRDTSFPSEQLAAILPPFFAAPHE